jgi:hypothetical protein
MGDELGDAGSQELTRHALHKRRDLRNFHVFSLQGGRDDLGAHEGGPCGCQASWREARGRSRRGERPCSSERATGRSTSPPRFRSYTAAGRESLRAIGSRLHGWVRSSNCAYLCNHQYTMTSPPRTAIIETTLMMMRNTLGSDC